MHRLLILGTGSMAEGHATGFKKEPDIEIVAAVETNPERLDEYADKFAIKKRFTSLDEAIAWGKFDAATNVTPDAVHYPTTMKLIAAGKHVLCEKPLATDYPKAKEMADAAEAAGLINMVNLTYRGSPGLQKVHEIVAAGELGEIRHIDAHYYQSWLVGKYWGDWRTEDRWLWRLSTKHGSKGVVGDIGIHVVDFATFAAGSDIASLTSRVKTFDKVEGKQIGKYELDANESFVMSVELANGALGTIQGTRWATGNSNDIRLSIFGTKGGVRVTSNGTQAKLEQCLGADIDTLTWKDVKLKPVPTVYARFAEALRTGNNGDPDFRRAANLQQILDICLTDSGSGVITIP